MPGDRGGQAWRSARHLPLAASGALRRLAEDPWRARAALVRALPATARVLPDAGADPHRALDRAVAEDRYDDAVALLDALPADDAQRPSCEAAVRRLGGQVQQVLDVPAPDRRFRRAHAAARRDAAEIGRPVDLPARPARTPSGDPAGPARILHVVTNSLPGVQAGSTIRTHRVAGAQLDAGWVAQVVTRPGFPVLTGALAAADTDVVDGVTYHRLLPIVAPSRAALPGVYRELLAARVEAMRPHLLHAASDHVNARAALEAGRAAGIPVAYEARGFPEYTWLSRHGGDAAVDTDTYRWLADRHTEVMRAADLVTTLGHAMRTAIIDRGVEPDRVVVTPNAVLPEYLGPRDPGAREALGLAGGELLVGTVTTVYPHEGLSTLVEAVARLRRDGLDARLLIVGSGPDLERVRARAADLGVPLTAPGRVPVASVRAYYDALDVFALPRTDDRVSRLVTALKPLEAQARGVPVVGSDLPAVAEVLAPGSRLVAPGDAIALAGALAEFSDPRGRSAAGGQAREWVAAHRTWPNVIEAYRSAYHRLGIPVRETEA